ncbi:hypothetical protein D9K77_18025 [Klebsiella pneumoniae]|nr:hypothetical protein D9K77_18025 [Klebsiella pneumoniae]
MSPCPAALRLRGPTRYEPVRGPCRPGKGSRHPAKLQVPCLISCPAALRLRGPARFEPVRGPCRPGKA